MGTRLVSPFKRAEARASRKERRDWKNAGETGSRGRRMAVIAKMQFSDPSVLHPRF
jgi:hypothetical protein